ncbi:uncharacterized protein LOC134611973 [Pelobates fuscus]|uniref:uncharacterized protein LOC134611973 n=1 Tax=Pelobates fuscus TaxID=191477 RepID=UPI002FE4E4A0
MVNMGQTLYQESIDIDQVILPQNLPLSEGEPPIVGIEEARAVIHTIGLLDVEGPISPGPELEPPPISCAGSEVLGDAVCKIILLEPENMRMVCENLSGRLLPKKLRQFIWMDKLLKSDKYYKGEISKTIEKEMRGKYGRTLEHKLAELKLRRATRSPISGMIENAVVEKYGNTPCMQNFAADEHMTLESSKTLNVLYVYNGTYEPYFIHWLFPLQMAFKQTPTTAEHPYELFMYLHLLIKNTFPSWLEIFAMAERVMSTLKTEDVELFTHLQHSFRKNINFDPKDFLVELIARERAEALKLYAHDSRSDQSMLQGELLASPVIFLRKWMGEGFVNSLDLPAVLLIWDQLFMQDWNHKVMESFCLAILLLLKDSIMSAKDYPAVRQVFLYEACHLFTSDIQRAWIHLQQGGLPADIPEMNRLKERQLPDQSPWLQEKICSLGVKDILMKLVLPLQKADTSSNVWLKSFDHNTVEVTVSLFYGDVLLISKTSSMKPILTEKLKLNEGSKNELISFTIKLNDVFEFDFMDRFEYVNDTKSGEKPFLLLKAVYSDGIRDVLPLGWTKVKAFKQETSNIFKVWKPQESSFFLSLHPGEDPDSTDESTPVSGMSSIQLTVYDPTSERQTKISTLEREKR